MLESLRVQNFALIDDLDMTFETGLSALTGETGAGKSIILESLNLLFGKRSDAQMIRHGAQKAVVSGRFLLSKKDQEKLQLNEVLEVEREIDQSGRHNMRLNGELVTLNKIKEVMRQIGTIHSQNETISLLDKATYLDFIDQMDVQQTEKLRNQYLLKRGVYSDAFKQHEKLKSQKADSLEKAEFYQFQINELKGLHLKHGEKADIEDIIEKMRHHDKILQQLRDANQLFDEEILNIDLIYQASKTLDKIASFDKHYETLAERLSSSYYELDDIKSHLVNALDALDFDEKTFNDLQERLYTLEKTEQKYHKTIDELLDYLVEIESQYLMITDYDHYVSLSEEKVKKAFDEAVAAGIRLSDLRKKCAKTFEKEILNQLQDLDLEKASFEVLFEEVLHDRFCLLESGIDSIEFMISLNEGEPIKPLARVASGGERARFMFALRAIDAIRNELSLLILDEIDIGISGKTAAKVAKKMVELSKNLQLIVITHLPQVAARANHHYDIIKIKEGNRMVTRIQKLNEEQRIEAIALMLSDEKLSSYAIEQAKMLLVK